MPTPPEETKASIYNTEGDLRVLVLDLPSNTKKFSVPLSKFVNENWTKEQVDNWQHGTLYCPVSKTFEDFYNEGPFVMDRIHLFWGTVVDGPIRETLWEKAHIVILGNAPLKCDTPI